MGAYTTVEMECAREGLDAKKVWRVFEHLHMADEEAQLIPELAELMGINLEAENEASYDKGHEDGLTEIGEQWASACTDALKVLRDKKLEPAAAISKAFYEMLPVDYGESAAEKLLDALDKLLKSSLQLQQDN